MSLYQYVQSKPTNSTDYYGLVVPQRSYFHVDDMYWELTIAEGVRGVHGETFPYYWRLEASAPLCLVHDDYYCRYVEVPYHTWGAWFWWSDTASLDHELVHVRIFRSWFNRLESRIHEVDEGCMCSKKARCFVSMLYKFKSAYYSSAYAQHMYFDCREHGDPRSACRAARRYQSQARRKLRAAYDKRRKCNSME